ncbi:GNAT family N-acetyltransferase [Staphylospora marina]|uniref:GNAT family N-acetyltransferase n=1 Tax=Staphylospora marina TaxID=2490858 RepID=UPI000F5C0B9D|nr:GNAT family protein [Staphylospora marina]
MIRQFETERLRAREIREDELNAFLEVIRTNRFFLRVSEGRPDYSLARLKHDWQEANTNPDECMLGLFDKSEVPCGILTYLRRNPRDGFPWIGFLIFRKDLHRQGLGREVMEHFLTLASERMGWTAVRLGVLLGNHPAQAAWERLGFRKVMKKEVYGLPQDHAGERIAWVMEKEL